MNSPVVLITGCSSGIGKALCWAFYRKGYQVVATARQAESLAALSEVGVTALSLDVTDISNIRQVVDTVKKEKGRVDVLINNAGFGQFGALMDISEAQLQKQFWTNAIAPIMLAQQVAPLMKARGAGLIVNIGSISGAVTTPFAGAYCASKAALHSLSESLRMELSPFNITVVTVQPGAVASNFGQSAEKNLSGVVDSSSWYARIEHKIRDRATLSQSAATPVDRFAMDLVEQLTQDRPAVTIRLGKKSTWLPLLKQILPVRLMESMLKRKFGLAASEWRDRSKICKEKDI